MAKREVYYRSDWTAADLRRLIAKRDAPKRMPPKDDGLPVLPPPAVQRLQAPPITIGTPHRRRASSTPLSPRQLALSSGMGHDVRTDALLRFLRSLAEQRLKELPRLTTICQALSMPPTHHSLHQLGYSFDTLERRGLIRQRKGGRTQHPGARAIRLVDSGHLLRTARTPADWAP